MGKGKKRIGRLTKIVIGIAAFFLVYTVFGFFIAPALLKSMLTKRLTEQLHREVAIQRIKINPYSLTLRVSGLCAGQRGQPGVFVSLDELYANLQALSVFKWAVIVSEFQLTSPYMNLVRTGDQSFNFSDLLKKKEAPESPSSDPSKPLQFSVSNIRITGGRIDFSDEPEKKTHRIVDLELTLPFVSNFPHHIKTNVEPYFNATVNGTPVSFQGKTRPFHESLETVLNVDIQNLDLTHYLPYVPFELPYNIDSGLIDMRMEVAYAQTAASVASLVVSGTTAVRDFRTTEKTGELLNEFRRADVSIGRSGLLSQNMHIEKVAVSSPKVNAVRNAAGKMNLAKLIVAKGGKKLKQAEPEKGFILTVDEIRLSDGRIDIRDETVNGPFTGSLEKIDMHVSGFTNDVGKQAQVALSLTTDAGEDVALDGLFSVNPLALQGNVSVKKVPLGRYAPYYQDQILFLIEAGDLDLQTDFSFAREDEQEPPQIQLSNLSTRLTGLRLISEPEKNAFFETPLIAMSDASVDVGRRLVTLGSVSTENGALRLIRSADGVISLTQLIPSAPTADEKQLSTAREGTSGGRWEVLLKKGEMSGYKVSFKDAASAQPVTLDIKGIDLKLEDIAATENSQGKMTLVMSPPGKGRFALTGKVGISPPVAELKIDVTGIDIQPYQPYWKDRVNVTVTDGAVSTKGNVSLSLPSGKDPSGRFKGRIEIADVRVIDNARAQDFLNWKLLEMSGLDMSLKPLRMLIEAVNLTDFYSRISVDEQGRVNLQDLAVSTVSKGDISAPPKTKGEAALLAPRAEVRTEHEDRLPIDIDVKSVHLKGGRIDYSDLFIRPHVEAELSQLEGAVTGLTSEENTHADVSIKGKVNQYAPLEITGKINPLGRDLYLDLKVRTEGVDLSPATPYAGKYMGYAIEKGKLSVQLEYLVDDRKLKADNRVFLDQFTLGQAVESPDATKLPVALAVSLLKNRAGEIKLDLPVTGSLDDPQFKVGKVILQVVVNLLEKVLTAPFALLGAIAGGGEELSYVEFKPGSVEIEKGEQEKLEKLAEVLYDRPGLRIEVEGHADLQADRNALRQKALMRKLKEQKLKVLTARGEGGKALKDIGIAPEEYETYLEMVYKAEKGSFVQERDRGQAKESH